MSWHSVHFTTQSGSRTCLLFAAYIEPYWRTLVTPNPTCYSLQDILSQMKNAERVQIYAPDLFAQDWIVPADALWISKLLFPQCLTSFTLAIYWSDTSSSSFGVLLTKLTSLEHLSIQCIGDFRFQYDVNVKATLPNLVSYQGPSILLQSLAQGSKRLSCLVLEVFTPSPLLQGTANPVPLLSEDPTLKHLKGIGASGKRDIAALLFLKIICDTPAAANVAMEFSPHVEHLSILCTSTEWITTDKLSTGSWHADFELDFLSHSRFLRKFSLSFVHPKQSLPWDMAVVAKSLGKMNSELLPPYVDGMTYRRSRTTTEDGTGFSWSRVLV
ncbi:hypothetical protein J3R30DRAFT_22365 [Lentinula aciculospora]|uniref:Uncharacterized protein n=1 Tax=Lentinula aciculospora TaxID=153920 RepID=A0A9W9AT92_9AGAR|nr:hypothetical protein J3R30DRAFT_22365 [Lentinula aciculospora]